MRGVRSLNTSGRRLCPTCAGAKLTVTASATSIVNVTRAANVGAGVAHGIGVSGNNLTSNIITND